MKTQTKKVKSFNKNNAFKFFLCIFAPIPATEGATTTQWTENINSPQVIEDPKVENNLNEYYRQITYCKPNH